jgi:hypothetical protein
MSRRDGAIVAWHKVPGKASLERTVPWARYDRAQLIPEVFLVEMCAEFQGRLNTYFVPGYDRTVSPGHFPKLS